MSLFNMQVNDPEEKVHDTTQGIADGVNKICDHCNLQITELLKSEFQCFPGSPGQVTYRAKVQDQAPATAREIVKHIELWISYSEIVQIPVHYVRVGVNKTCGVLLSSLNEPECRYYLMTTVKPQK